MNFDNGDLAVLIPMVLIALICLPIVFTNTNERSKSKNTDHDK